MSSIPLPIHPPTPAAALPPHPTCTLDACRPGVRATVLDVGCGSDDACRLRALGLCEGTSVKVIDVRHALLLDVRGTRIALGAALAAAITVQLLAGHAG